MVCDHYISSFILKKWNFLTINTLCGRTVILLLKEDDYNDNQKNSNILFSLDNVSEHTTIWIQ